MRKGHRDKLTKTHLHFGLHTHTHLHTHTYTHVQTEGFFTSTLISQWFFPLPV
jgi:hypothetical protein